MRCEPDRGGCVHEDDRHQLDRHQDSAHIEENEQGTSHGDGCCGGANVNAGATKPAERG